MEVYLLVVDVVGMERGVYYYSVEYYCFEFLVIDFDVEDFICWNVIVMLYCGFKFLVFLMVYMMIFEWSMYCY